MHRNLLTLTSTCSGIPSTTTHILLVRNINAALLLSITQGSVGLKAPQDASTALKSSSLSQLSGDLSAQTFMSVPSHSYVPGRADLCAQLYAIQLVARSINPSVDNHLKRPCHLYQHVSASAASLGKGLLPPRFIRHQDASTLQPCMQTLRTRSLRTSLSYDHDQEK